MLHARSAPISAHLFLLLAAVALPAQAQLTGTTTQLTTNPATQLDPAISGDVVVFTDLRNGNEDVYYVDVSTMTEVQVTSSAANQRLHDVDGSNIVFTDLGSPGAALKVYDVTTGITTSITSGPSDQNVRIDGVTAVFERGFLPTVDIYAVDISSLAVTPVAIATDLELNPVISGTRVVYERRATTASVGEIVVVDLTTGIEQVLGHPALDDRRADIDGDLLVWDVLTPAGDTDIMVHDLATGTGKTLALPGNQRGAHVSGRVVAFDDDSSGSWDVMLHHVDLLVTEAVAAGPGSEFLNDIDGDRVVYTSNQSGNFDIWLFEFQLGPPACDYSDDLCADTTGFSEAFAASFVRSTGQPQVVSHTFSAAPGPAALVVHNNGCSAAVATLNGVAVLLPEHLNQQVTCLTNDVMLAASNTLDVEVRSTPDCSIDVSFMTLDACLETTTSSMTMGSGSDCQSSAFGGMPSVACGLALLALARVRRRLAG